MKRAEERTSRTRIGGRGSRYLVIVPGLGIVGLVLLSVVQSERGTRGARPALERPTRASEPRLQLDSGAEVARLRRAAHQGAEYLKQAVHPNGRLEYRINLNPDVSVNSRYNLLRHAGSIYALATYQQQHPRADTIPILERSARYLIDNAVGPVDEQPGLLAVWSRPEITGSDSLVQAKLGGAGLTLAALLTASEVGAEGMTLDELRGLGRFILYMQKSDGSFYSKYIPGRGGRSDKWTSLYYPGEAALGLVLLYERDPRTKWLEAASRAIEYLALSRRGRSKVEADHWALIASSRLLSLPDDADHHLPRDVITRHAVQICESILNTQADFPSNSPLHGAFTPDGRTCPTATRLEGLLAARLIIPATDVSLHQRIELAISHGLRFLMRSQISDGPGAGGVPRAPRLLSKQHPSFSDRFNRRATEVRIDYVQHALSAMLGHEQSLAEAPCQVCAAAE